MINIAIADDEPEEREKMNRFVKAFFEEKGRSCSVSLFSDGSELIDQWNENFQILLLDIQMEKMSGMEAAREIRRRNSDALIIFITNLAQYAIEGYSVHAYNFVLKPVSYYFVSQELEKVLSVLDSREPKSISIRNGDGQEAIRLDDILYIENANRKILLHLRDRDVWSNETMPKFEQRTEGYCFFRIHNSYIVNMKYVKSLKGNIADLGQYQLVVSKQRLHAFSEALTDYLSSTIGME